jgi:hypothetical protein
MGIGYRYLNCFALHLPGVAKLTVLAVQDVHDVISLANLKAKAATFAEPFRSTNLWIPEGTPIHENKLSYWNPIPWDDRNGRIALAGDAAHLMIFRKLLL